jgi:hypothetical protein
VKPRGVLLAVLLALVGCSGHSTTPSPTPEPTVTQAPNGLGGFVDTTRCNALRVTIRSNEQALLTEQAAGHDSAVAELKATIATDLAAARATTGCDVHDLATAPP